MDNIDMYVVNSHIDVDENILLYCQHRISFLFSSAEMVLSSFLSMGYFRRGFGTQFMITP